MLTRAVRQVQDLEKQLAAAKQTIQQLTEAVGATDGSPFSQPGHDRLWPKVPEVGSVPERRPQAPPMIKDLAEVRAYLRDYGRDVFKPPPPYRQVGKQEDFRHPILPLPPGEIGCKLLARYYETIHNVIPILHWPGFTENYEKIKNKKDSTGVSPVWGSILFVVFACGIVYSTDPEIRELYPDNGRTYIEYSRQLTDLFNDEFTLDHARAALLTSIYLAEINCKSASWTWLGCTVRIAQDIGLHRESGPAGAGKVEMRRRVWWGIYAWDRYALFTNTDNHS